MTADSAAGPWRIDAAVPFVAEPTLFAAPLVQTRSGGWALIGFRNSEPEAMPTFDIVDPIPVRLHNGALIAD
ncbi:MAG TPA: hypothetical protein VJ851_01415 [Jatrophihabitans sp.]|nr:hypothetical protein [Jatrophihabitans sp.]